MIMREEITSFSGKKMIKTWSTAGKFVVSAEGELYVEAVDEIGSGREYLESSVDIPAEEAEEFQQEDDNAY